MRKIVELERMLSRAEARAQDAERALSKVAGQLEAATAQVEAWREAAEGMLGVADRSGNDSEAHAKFEYARALDAKGTE